MFELFQMWALVEVLGVGCLPLSFAIFHNLPDRGWAFSKAMGMVTLAFCVWLPLVCILVLPFSQQFILGIGLILAACSILAWLRLGREVAKVVRHNLIYVVATEIVFLGMVFLLGWVRSFGPDIRSYEMFMDEGFVASIMRSPHFPPNDMWFSGYSINYYYYAHYTIAVLAKFLGQSPSVAFNTGICIFFGLCAVNLFGLTTNVVAWARHLRKHVRAKKTTPIEPIEPTTALPALLPAIPYGILSCLMALIFGNLAATQQWWISHDSPNFDLYGFWFGSTRVLSPAATTINEFPAFSFLLSCFHAHVLTLAFTVLAMALAFNLFLAAKGKGLLVFGQGWRLPITLTFTALVIGGLFIMNSWDYPTYMGITVICIILQQWLAHNSRLSTKLLLNILLSAGALVALSLIFYLPFLLNFVAPSQGIGLVTPNLRSLLNQELLIYGLFAFVFLSLLLVSVFKSPLFTRVELAELLVKPGELPADTTFAYDIQKVDAPVDVLTDTASFDTSSEVTVEEKTQTDEGEEVEEGKEQKIESVTTHDAPVSRLRDVFSPGFIMFTLCVIYLVACLIALRVIQNSTTFVASSSLAVLGVGLVFYHLRNRAHAFALLLGAVAFALVAVCEIIYLRDVFAGTDYERMNTVFKFYFQAWVLLSVACGVGVFFVIDGFLERIRLTRVVAAISRYVIFGIWSLLFLLLVLASMVYPLNAPYARYARIDTTSSTPHLVHSPTLDGLAYMATCKPPSCDYDTSGDYKAIVWLNTNVQGDPGIVEAIGDDYSSYGRISAFTGLSAPMGWIGHEYQWRVIWITKSAANNGEYQRRSSDVDQIYTSTDANTVLSIMAHDQVQYLYVGALERVKYPHSNLSRYSTFMQVVYQNDGVTIYKVR
jgi:uncharacterized membrane protein